ncbi:prepilin-type N-terminal cleavage/methylation domain-containing protein [Thalassococcus lentus]|uniref:Prepilin-type N-terminal cleavage/methylation domain-containing protein n=1 Tax=Thalassococcus lentus TaxID=1210524 RepID=A0ABT4XUK7_9RHOB|nr:prepilin-type N-terminal cleavage/methylation domain-containing protein [Thalassococcus lentus]MDA7425613.1 prepilin-type N-terminal cleavage/methylation domain-containing protein [Thalassococcus lentus]
MPSWARFWRSTKLRFDSQPRSNNRGFSLLETLLSMAAVSVVLVSVYSVSAGLIDRQAAAQRDLELAQVARALLDEYVVTFPLSDTAGTYKGTWDWFIREKPYVPDHKTEQDHLFRFVEVTAQVNRSGSTRAPYVLSTILARRAPGI